MSNSRLFKQAHKMTKLTIQPSETYRYKFGQWLIFLKTGITNVLRMTNINQSCAYVPILNHDKTDKFKYKLSLPLTLTRYNRTGYSESYYLDNMLFSVLKFICTNPLSLFLMSLMMMFIVLIK